MSVDGLKFLWLAYLSRPASDRAIYRLLRKRKLRQVIELGLGDCRRALRMISVMRRHHGLATIRYIGIDQFEARSSGNGPPLPLKTAHRLLRHAGVRPLLVPGEPAAALARVARTLTGAELVIISAEHTADSLAPAWFYLARAVARDAVIYQEWLDGQGKRALKLLPAADLQRLASRPRRLAA